MTPEHFSALVEAVRQYLEDLSQTNPAVIAACKSGEDFEVCVRDAAEAVLLREGIHAEIQYEQGSHTFPDIVLVGSGLSYYRRELMEKAEWRVESGACDMVGFGRVSLAYPELYSDYKKGEFDWKKTCVACSKCTALMRSKCVSGCAVYNEYYKNLYKEKVLCKR